MLRIRYITCIMAVALLCCPGLLRAEAQSRQGDIFFETSKVWIKTNIPYYATLMPNLALEVKLADHWSLDLPVFYSPFEVSDTYRFRTLTLQPSIRYFFGDDMMGHFVGVHGHSGLFNISVDRFNRYQDINGMWGGGLDYGYVLKFSRHWGMEFNLGVGYIRTRYSVYHNTDNGARYDSGTANYFGITRLGISLVFKL